MQHKKITKAGGLSIPIQLRREYNIQAGDVLEVEMGADGTICLSPYLQRCVFCNSTDQVISINGKGICKCCANQAVAVILEAFQMEETKDA